MEKELVKEIYKLIDLVTEAPTKTKKSPQKRVDLVGIPKIISLKNIQEPVEYRIDAEGQKVEAYKEIGGLSIGFNETNFRYFRKVINQIIEISPYSKYSSVEFIEKHLFNWILETYSSKMAKSEPQTYLEEKLSEELKTYTFRFKLKAAGIAKEFQIGNVLLTFFTKEELNIEFEKFKKASPDKTRDEFDQLFKTFTKTPLVKVTVTGTIEKAKSLAKHEATNAINGLKCFLQKESMDDSCKILDVDFQFSEIQPNWFIYNSSSTEFDYLFNMERNDGAVPMHLHETRIEELFSSGLDIMSNFLRQDRQTEFEVMLMNSIERMGSIISTRDLHDRCVKIVSLYEHLFLPSTKGQGKGLTIIKNSVLPKFVVSEELSIFQEYVIAVYNVRDKYLHNGVRLKLSTKEIFLIQMLANSIILRLIQLRSTFKTRNDIIKHFEIKKRP